MEITLSDFFFNVPIYSPIKIETEDDMKVLRQIIDATISKDFHGYNPIEKVESTFRVTTDLIPSGSNSKFLKEGGFGTVNIKCKRTEMLFWYYIYWVPKQNTLTKVGQYPSVADFHIYEIKQYNKLLPTERLKEFTRAIGLAANGVGIGSFVYLRRLFEHLINEAYDKALKEESVNEGDFCKARMDEKIDLLHNYLPAFLVGNKSMYSILSIGIHELDEETCLANFDTIRVAIEIILDEKLDELRKEEKIRAATKKLELLKGSLKK